MMEQAEHNSANKPDPRHYPQPLFVPPRPGCLEGGVGCCDHLPVGRTVSNSSSTGGRSSRNNCNHHPRQGGRNNGSVPNYHHLLQPPHEAEANSANGNSSSSPSDPTHRSESPSSSSEQQRGSFIRWSRRRKQLRKQASTEQGTAKEDNSARSFTSLPGCPAAAASHMNRACSADGGAEPSQQHQQHQPSSRSRHSVVSMGRVCTRSPVEDCAVGTTRPRADSSTPSGEVTMLTGTSSIPITVTTNDLSEYDGAESREGRKDGARTEKRAHSWGANS